MSGITPFTMLPGAGPACEGDDCLPAAPAADGTTGEEPATGPGGPRRSGPRE